MQQGWHLSFTQIFPRVKRCLGKIEKNCARPLFFPLNRIVLPIGRNRFTHKMKQFYPYYETREAHTENVPVVHITLTKDNIE